MASPRRNLAALTLLVLIVALIPRILPRDILTVDETFHWIGRSTRFLEALQAGDWRNTAQTFHPGVMTTWFGAAGILLSRVLYGANAAQLDYYTLINTVRIPLALFNTLTVVVSYWLLRRLLNPRSALVAALVWATEPFIVAHSAILHIDALSMSFMALSLLSGWYALKVDAATYEPENSVRWPYLVLSAVTGGMAVLTKYTSGFVFPMIALHSYFWLWPRDLRRPPKPFIAVIVWPFIALAVWFALYPATWGNLDYVISWLKFGTSVALAPHERGNYFLGQPIEDPGFLLYPVTVVLRLTPWALIGVVFSVVAAFSQRLRPHRKVILSTLLAAFLYMVVMVIQPKKFDRYIIQIFPLLAILAGCGLTWIADQVYAGLRQRVQGSLSVVRAAAWAVALAVMVLNLAGYHPYYLAYYNPLLGSNAVVQTMLVGWGEGLDQITAYMQEHNAPCDPEFLGDLSQMPVLYEYAPCILAAGYSPEMLAESDYVVFYVSMIQRHEFGGYEEAVTQVEPIYTVNIHGIEYARVYERAALDAAKAASDDTT